MSVMIECSKCRGPIEVDDSTLAEFAKAGVPVKSQHEQCPTEEEPNTYRAVITVEKNGQPIAQVGTTLQGMSFDAVFSNITKEINRQWEQIGQRAMIADLDPTEDQDSPS